jgi:hypothetical protein
MVYFEQKLGSLGQPRGGGNNFRKRSITDIKFISSENNKKLYFTFLNFIFINSNWLYTKPIKVRGRLRLVHGSATATARHCARSLEGMLLMIILFRVNEWLPRQCVPPDHMSWSLLTRLGQSRVLALSELTHQIHL